MELRRYLTILKRQKWLIIQATVIVGLVAGVLSGMKTPTYRSTSQVLLRPNDSREQLNPGYSVEVFSDPDRYVAAQMDIVRSENVAREAAKAIPGATADAVRGEVGVSQGGLSDVLLISGTSIDPERARDVANAFAAAYIENRRAFAVSGLQKASTEIESKLTDLKQKIAELDGRIGDGGLQPGASATLTGEPAGPAGGPALPAKTPATPSTDYGQQPTTKEALKAERYAAAVQYASLFTRQQDLLVETSLKQGEAELVEKAALPGAPFSPKPKRDGALGAFVGLLLGLGVAFLREQLDDRLRSRDEVAEANGAPVLAELPIDPASVKDPAYLAARQQPAGMMAEASRSLRTSLHFAGIDRPLKRLVVTSPGPGDGKSLVAANLAVAYAQAGYRTVLVSADVRRPSLHRLFGLKERQRGLTELVADVPGGLPVPAGVMVFTANGHGTTTGNDTTTGNGNGNGGARRRRTPVEGVSREVLGAAMGAVAAEAQHPPDEDRSPADTPPSRPPHQVQDVRSALVDTDVENLWVLPAGACPPNPAELLGSRRMGEVLDHLGGLADVVIIDTPPVLAVTDAAVLATAADGVLLVNSLGETHRSAAVRAKATIEAAKGNVVGVVANKVDPSNSDDYHYYHAYYGTTPAEPARRRPWRRGRTTSAERKQKVTV